MQPPTKQEQDEATNNYTGYIIARPSEHIPTILSSRKLQVAQIAGAFSAGCQTKSNLK